MHFCPRPAHGFSQYLQAAGKEEQVKAGGKVQTIHERCWDPVTKEQETQGAQVRRWMQCEVSGAQNVSHPHRGNVDVEGVSSCASRMHFCLLVTEVCLASGLARPVHFPGFLLASAQIPPLCKQEMVPPSLDHSSRGI